MFSLFPPHLSLILLNSRGKDLGVTRSYWSLFPRQFIPAWVREQDKNGRSWRISWLCVSSRNKFLAFVLWSCCLFKTTLSFAECNGIGCFATWFACPKNVLMMWSPLVFWVQCLFNVGLKPGHPSSQVLLLSVTRWHHIFSRWCQPCTVTAHHMQTFSISLAHSSMKMSFFYSSTPRDNKNMRQEDITSLSKSKFCLHTSCLKLAAILGLNNVCRVWNIFWSTPGRTVWKYLDVILSLKYYISTIWKKSIFIFKLQEVFCACWTWYLIILLIKIDYGCFSTDEVVGENTFFFSSESWQYVKKKKKLKIVREGKKSSHLCARTASYWSLRIHCLCPGRDAKYKVCEVDRHQHCLCVVPPHEIVGCTHSTQAKKKQKGNVKCVNAEHGIRVRGKECDTSELPASFKCSQRVIDREHIPCDGMSPSRMNVLFICGGSGSTFFMISKRVCGIS